MAASPRYTLLTHPGDPHCPGLGVALCPAAPLDSGALPALSVSCLSPDFAREVESRARLAEDKFEDVNEQLHYTLIRNKDLEKELEEMVMKTRKKETEGEEDNERDKEEGKEDEAEEKEEEEIKPAESASKPLKKGGPASSVTGGDSAGSWAAIPGS